ncbi:sensor histidine kinase [Hymenobacter actinosclerus]|uniref:histidine kinase n=1 Tax=Hymenobacter actinosclerus TaxID=82805 RepID=A0A1I0DUA6_9BACT|nr:PAS domain-containing sensor histidine kinase [Hymenobacter actinosclerus]SET36223.1 Signal transduction histidine kinase [Hymenobacter actinosclerus]
MLSPAAALAPDAVLLRELLAVSLTGVILYSPVYDPAGSGEIVDFTFEYLNPAAQRMMAMPEVPTVTHNQQWPHSRAHGTLAFHIDAFESGEPREYNVNYQADGYDNYYRLAARRAGAGLLVSFTDTADQPRSPVEVALRESQAAEKTARAEAEAQRQRFYEVLMQLPAYVAVYHGPDHVYQLVNPPYQSLFPHRSFMGRPFREGTPEAGALGVVALFDQVYQTGEPYYAHEMEGWFDFQGKGQPEQVFLNLYLHPLRDPHGRIDGLLDFSYNVTEQVRARQQVEQLNQQLEARVQQRTEELMATNRQLTRTNVDLDNFIYTASHDLKAPITNIEGLLHLLRAELPAAVAASEYVAPTLQHLFDAVDRFMRTIEHLTEVSKLQKEHTPDLVAVDLAAVVENVRLDLAPQLRDTSAHLTVAVADCPAVLFSEKNLRSVVYNLLSNALKYQHPARRPRVEVRARVQGPFVVLEVHDNGLGLDAAHLPRLFTMFQRFHSHVEGTGIGLFMVKRMVENAGGRVEVRSTLGEGAAFFVYLPHAPAGPAAA